MITKFTALSSVFITTALLSSNAPVARAESLNTAGTVCRNYNAREALDIDFLQDGARYINDSPRPVICPIPRPSQVAGGNVGDEVPPVSFFIDGWNAPNTSTSSAKSTHRRRSSPGETRNTRSRRIPAKDAGSGRSPDAASR